jgi:hypothetical protein
MSFIGVRPRHGIEVYMVGGDHVCMRQIEANDPPRGCDEDDDNHAVVAIHIDDIDEFIAALKTVASAKG